jgi:hypothetical protein
MAGFSNTAALVAAYDAGQTSLYTWRKTPSAVSAANNWFDLSMSPGNPIPNYYAAAPLISATLDGTLGLPVGQPVSPLRKFLRRAMILATSATPLPMNFVLCDYLLYYPFIDMGTNDPQNLTTSVTLPRYATGDGVRAMLVMTNPQTTGLLQFTFTYTNQAGVSGNVAPTQTSAASTAISVLWTTASTSAVGPFLTLAGIDSGIRSVESFTITSGTDVGLLALVLVKPLATLALRGIDAVVERDFFLDGGGFPVILDGAYLNYIAMTTGSFAAVPFHGTIETVWG